MSSDNDAGKYFLDEWDTSRTILNNFDERLHDLRKYGFSFITALLSAESILIPWQSNQTSALPNGIKLTVFAVNLLLIVAVRLIDRNYAVFQNAAATRARVLERILNLELTEIISDRYVGSKVHDYVTVLYVFFIFGVAGIGTVELFNAILFLGLLWIFVIIALVAVIWGFGRTVKINYPWGPIDWSFDRLECNPGDDIGITLTNLDYKRGLNFEPGCVMLQIRKLEDNSVVKTYTVDRPIAIAKGDYYTWIWDTKGQEVGVYQVYRAVLREETLKKLEKVKTNIDEIFFKKLEKVKTNIGEEVYRVKSEFLTEKTLEPLERKIRIKPAIISKPAPQRRRPRTPRRSRATSARRT